MERHVTIPELAKLLGVSRIAVYNRVRKGQIPATRAGRTYIITDKTVAGVLGRDVSLQRKRQIDAAVARTVREYGEVLRFLGDE